MQALHSSRYLRFLGIWCNEHISRSICTLGGVDVPHTKFLKVFNILKALNILVLPVPLVLPAPTSLQHPKHTIRRPNMAKPL